jgi:hypothetical protein
LACDNSRHRLLGVPRLFSPFQGHLGLVTLVPVC